VIEIQWPLQLCFIEAHHLQTVPPEDVVHLLLLFQGVDTSHIVIQNGELDATLQHLLLAISRFLSLFTTTFHVQPSIRCVALTRYFVVVTRTLTVSLFSVSVPQSWLMSARSCC
jgi:hypothetical protein